jgi:hypothetical protein
LLHGIQPLQFDACISGAELPVDRADLLITMLLPALNLLTELLDGGNVVGQVLSLTHIQFNLGNIEPARMFGRVMDL